MALRDDTLEIIRLAKVWAAEENAEAEGSMGTTLQEAAEKLGEPPKASWQATHDRIANLSEEDHFKLTTIRYAGRDRRKDFVDYYEQIGSTFDDAHDCRRQMTEKVPLGQYLESGLKLAKEVGFDVNGSWE